MDAAPDPRGLAASVPADLLDLSVWKVDLPDLTQVTQPHLAAFADPAHFTVDEQAVTSTAECSGNAHPGSQYPRSELREMSPDPRRCRADHVRAD